MHTSKIKVILDSNVFVSGLLWRGKPYQILKLIENGKITCFATIEIIDEIEDVLGREKFSGRLDMLETSVDELMLAVTHYVNIVKKSKKLKLKPSEQPEDPDDVMFIECAATVGAEYVVSGDPHLLDLKYVRGIKILTPAEFLKEIHNVQE